MQDQSVRKCLQNCLAVHFDTVLARITVVVLDSFTCGQSLKAIENTLLIFDLECQIIEWFCVFPYISATLANHNWAGLSSENILKKVFLRCSPDRVLQTIEYNIQEFLGVLLFSRVCGPVIEILEREAELSWIVILSLRKL